MDEESAEKTPIIQQHRAEEEMPVDAHSPEGRHPGVPTSSGANFTGTTSSAEALGSQQGSGNTEAAAALQELSTTGKAGEAVRAAETAPEGAQEQPPQGAEEQKPE